MMSEIGNGKQKENFLPNTSYYNFLKFEGTLVSYSDMWNLQIPLKVKVLNWLVIREKFNS